MITVELLEKVLGKSGNWFTGVGGTAAFRQKFKQDCAQVYAFDKYKFVDILNNKLERYELTSAYHRAHFIAQSFVESARFESTLEFGSGENYNPGIHPSAEKYGNTVLGDGPRYRGRGLIQLTWKNNYRKYSDFVGIDYVSTPDAISQDMATSIDVSCWYWRHNGGIHKKYNAQGDINILINNENANVDLVTLAVNGGTNALAERKQVFELIRQEWMI